MAPGTGVYPSIVSLPLSQGTNHIARRHPGAAKVTFAQKKRSSRGFLTQIRVLKGGLEIPDPALRVGSKSQLRGFAGDTVCVSLHQQSPRALFE
jgi:hypothetical protein